MRFFLRSTLFILAAILPLSVFAEIRYRVIDLGEIPEGTYYFPTRIYNSKSILGTAYDSDFFTSQAFRWQPTTGMTALSLPVGAWGSSPAALGPTGQIVGWSSFFGGPYGSYTQVTLWDSANNARLIGPVPQYGSYAGDIGADGTISGQFDFFPVLWASNGSLSYLSTPATALPYGGAARMNKAGQIIGYSYDAASFQQISVIWSRNHTPTVIATAPYPGSYPNDINDRGSVVGYAGQRAFVWSPSTGTAFLPGLGTTPEYSYASGINNSMQIVGSSIPPFGYFTSAVLWENGSVTDLNSLIDPNGGWFLSTADAINDQGLICGFGVNFSNGPNGPFLYHGYLLEPIQ